MRIEALDLKKQIGPIRKEIDSVIREVIDSTGFILGNKVAAFEEHVVKYSGAKYAVGVSNGTDAISLALLAVGIKPGDGVICPTFTYFATAGAVANIGARPVFADIDRDTYNISPVSIEKLLTWKKKLNIKAIVPVHLYGQCADMKEVLRLARKAGIKVVEDTAQSFGAEFMARKAGTMGDCGTVSFYPGKNLGAFGDAGLVLTNNKLIAERLGILRNQGNKNRYYHVLLGRNNRLDAIQAAVLDVKLKYLDGWNKKRSEVARYYNAKFSPSGIKIPFVPAYTTHIYHQYTLRAKVSNKKVVERLQSNGIDARVFYPVPLHLQECFKYLGHKPGDFPEAELAAKQVFSLPIYPEMTKKEMDYIVVNVEKGLNP
jgi:dTDP-4-amino-4,6-dideoxygalactose transaminase